MDVVRDTSHIATWQMFAESWTDHVGRLSEGMFELAFCRSDDIESLAIGQTMSALCRAVKPGGLICVYVPHIYDPVMEREREVIRQLILAFTSRGGTVVSPVAGMALYGAEAIKLDRRFYGCEGRYDHFANALQTLNTVTENQEKKQ